MLKAHMIHTVNSEDVLHLLFHRVLPDYLFQCLEIDHTMTLPDSLFDDGLIFIFIDGKLGNTLALSLSRFAFLKWISIVFDPGKDKWQVLSIRNRLFCMVAGGHHSLSSMIYLAFTGVLLFMI